jgi:hypothetical protein
MDFNSKNSAFASYFDNDAQFFRCKKFTFGEEVSDETYSGGQVANYYSAGSGSRVRPTANILQCIDQLKNISEFNLCQIQSIITELYGEVSQLDEFVSSNFDLYYATTNNKLWSQLD